MFCAFTRPRYKVSVYRTIGRMVVFTVINTKKTIIKSVIK